MIPQREIAAPFDPDHSSHGGHFAVGNQRGRHDFCWENQPVWIRRRISYGKRRLGRRGNVCDATTNFSSASEASFSVADLPSYLSGLISLSNMVSSNSISHSQRVARGCSDPGGGALRLPLERSLLMCRSPATPVQIMLLRAVGSAQEISKWRTLTLFPTARPTSSEWIGNGGTSVNYQPFYRPENIENGDEMTKWCGIPAILSPGKFVGIER